MEVNESSIFITGRSQRGHVEWTVKEYAAKERVAVSTVRRWIQKGAVDYRKTPGGGIRIRG